MKHVGRISATPSRGEDMAPEVKLAFIVDIIEVSIPLVQNKDPSNPAPTS